MAVSNVSSKIYIYLSLLNVAMLVLILSAGSNRTLVLTVATYCNYELHVNLGENEPMLGVTASTGHCCSHRDTNKDSNFVGMVTYLMN